MNISRTKFVILFLISVNAFMFISNALFGTDARVLPKPPDSLLGTDSPIFWKSAGYKMLYPVKIVLLGPVLPLSDFLRQDPDPPPPFVAAPFIVYWTFLALAIHKFLSKLKHRI